MKSSKKETIFFSILFNIWTVILFCLIIYVETKIDASIMNKILMPIIFVFVPYLGGFFTKYLIKETPDYEVICDNTNNTKETLEEGKIIVDIYFKNKFPYIDPKDYIVKVKK